MKPEDLSPEEMAVYAAWIAELDRLCWDRDRKRISDLRSPTSLFHAWRGSLAPKEMYWYTSQAPTYR